MATSPLQRYLRWSIYVTKRLTHNHINPRLPTIDGKAGNYIIRELLNQGSPFLAGRVGSTELLCWAHVNGLAYYHKAPQMLKKLSGIYPADWKTLATYTLLLEEAVREVDVLAVFGWNNEKDLTRILGSGVHLVPPKTLEPYFYPNEGWWHGLGGKKVLFVTSFATEIKDRFTKNVLRKLWPEEKNFTTILPAQISAVDTPYGWDPVTQQRFPTFKHLFEHIQDEISAKDFDLAVLGCGAYGLPLSAWIKKQGKSAIYLGGVIQVWGGIKGKRFETMIPWENIINEHWIKPPPEKTPQNPHAVAEGSYW